MQLDREKKEKEILKGKAQRLQELQKVWILSFTGVDHLLTRSILIQKSNSSLSILGEQSNGGAAQGN